MIVAALSNCGSNSTPGASAVNNNVRTMLYADTIRGAAHAAISLGLPYKLAIRRFESHSLIMSGKEGKDDPKAGGSGDGKKLTPSEVTEHLRGNLRKVIDLGARLREAEARLKVIEDEKKAAAAAKAANRENRAPKKKE